MLKVYINTSDLPTEVFVSIITIELSILEKCSRLTGSRPAPLLHFIRYIKAASNAIKSFTCFPFFFVLFIHTCPRRQQICFSADLEKQITGFFLGFACCKNGRNRQLSFMYVVSQKAVAIATETCEIDVSLPFRVETIIINIQLRLHFH